MLEDSSKMEGPNLNTSSVQSHVEESNDPIGEMIEVFHSLGIMVARGPSMSIEEFGDPADWTTGAVQVGAAPPEYHSCSVSSLLRIVDPLASEAT
jgi:hypothetical protein